LKLIHLLSIEVMLNGLNNEDNKHYKSMHYY